MWILWDLLVHPLGSACSPAAVQVVFRGAKFINSQKKKPDDVRAKPLESLDLCDANWLAGTRVATGQDPKACRHGHGL